MTEEECNAAIGNLIKQYADNERNLSALKTEIRDLRYALRNLSDAIERPASVKVSETDGNKIFQIDYQTRKDLTTSALNRLYKLLSDYHDSIGRKKEMESDLKQANLENLIVEETDY